MNTVAARVAVILNPSSGPKREGAPKEAVAAAFRAAGLDAEIILLNHGLDVATVVREQARNGLHAVVAAGGDGTVSSVGAALAGTGTPLGILPTGTLNHFARDLLLPSELAEAAVVIANGETAQVDVAEVNGRVFLNNSSIGLYPAMVLEREALMGRGVPKRLATAGAALTALWRFPNSTVRVTVDGGRIMARTPLLFVGNNPYEFAGMEAGTRARLQEGLLQLATVDHPSRGALFHSLFMAMIGKVDAAPNLHSVTTKRARVETFRRHVKVAVDGEVVRMKSPLEYSIRPGALKVLVAARTTEAGS